MNEANPYRSPREDLQKTSVGTSWSMSSSAIQLALLPLCTALGALIGWAFTPVNANHFEVWNYPVGGGAWGFFGYIAALIIGRVIVRAFRVSMRDYAEVKKAQAAKDLDAS